MAINQIGIKGFDGNISYTDIGVKVANIEGTLPVNKGGTGATTAAAALTNLGLTATATELNVLDGITASTAELNYTDGVTSNIQTQLNNKVDKVSGKGLSTNDYTTAEKTKLSGIATGAEVNQNAFSNVVVGSTTIAADTKTDSLTFVAGSNVTLTPDATNDKITIAATDTTYSAATQSANGLMSAADKKKLDGIATGANAYSLPTASTTVLGGVKSGSSVTSTTGLTACPIINGIPYYKDTDNDLDTHYTTGIRAGASGTNANSATANPYIKVLDNTTYRSQIRLVGGGATTISSDANGNITITSTDNNTTYSAATQSAAGLMSAADKTKLDAFHNLTPITDTYTGLSSYNSNAAASQKALNNAYSSLNNTKAPTNHAATATTYGQGNASNYGHVKVSDNYTASAGNAASGIAASSAAVNSVYSILNTAISNKGGTTLLVSEKDVSALETLITLNANISSWATAYKGFAIKLRSNNGTDWCKSFYIPTVVAQSGAIHLIDLRVYTLDYDIIGWLEFRFSDAIPRATFKTTTLKGFTNAYVSIYGIS